jgi:hypothetical protein
LAAWDVRLILADAWEEAGDLMRAEAFRQKHGR